MMTKAKEYMSSPETPADLCSSLSMEKITAIRMWMDNDGERNGPIFYSKLINFFVNGYQEFRSTYDQWTNAKTALERAFTYRMHVLFMTPEGTMLRDSLREVIDQRVKNIEDEAKAMIAHQTRQNDITNAMNNPEVIAAMMQNPQVQAMLAQMMRGGGAGAPSGGMNSMDV
jgi:hypothetical protein